VGAGQSQLDPNTFMILMFSFILKALGFGRGFLYF